MPEDLILASRMSQSSVLDIEPCSLRLISIVHSLLQWHLREVST